MICAHAGWSLTGLVLAVSLLAAGSLALGGLVGTLVRWWLDRRSR